jgi:hypothetical protein
MYHLNQYPVLKRKEQRASRQESIKATYRVPDVCAMQVLEDVEKSVEQKRVVLGQLIIVGELLGGQQPQPGIDGRRLVHRIALHFFNPT